MSFTLNAVAQAKGSHSNTGANDSAEPLNTTRSRSRTPGAKGGVSPTSSHHLFSRERIAFPFSYGMSHPTRFQVFGMIASIQMDDVKNVIRFIEEGQTIGLVHDREW